MLSTTMPSAIEKINVSGLNLIDKNKLKALLVIHPNLRTQIQEDDQCNDDLMREYLKLLSQGKLTSTFFIIPVSYLLQR